MINWAISWTYALGLVTTKSTFPYCWIILKVFHFHLQMHQAWLMFRSSNSCKKNLNVLSKNTAELSIQTIQLDLENFCFGFHPWGPFHQRSSNSFSLSDLLGKLRLRLSSGTCFYQGPPSNGLQLVALWAPRLQWFSLMRCKMNTFIKTLYSQCCIHSDVEVLAKDI